MHRLRAMETPPRRRPEMHVTLRQLEVFEAVARLGSVTRAAEALHLSQSAVSAQLRQIAETVDQPLLAFADGRLTLTEIGEDLIRTAGEIFETWARFERSAAERKALRKGRVRIACVTTAGTFLPGLLAVFRERHPGIDVALKIADRDGVIDRLARQEDDLSVMGMPPQQFDLALQPFLDNPLLPVVPLDHPFARAREVALEDFAAEPLLMRERGSGTRLAVERWFREQGSELRVHSEFDTNEAVLEAVAAGQGVSVLSRHALPAAPRKAGIAVPAVAGFPIGSHWYVMHPGRRPLSAAAQACLDFLLGEARGFVPAVNARRKR